MKQLFTLFALLGLTYTLAAQDLVKGDLKSMLSGGSFVVNDIASYNVVESKQTGFAGAMSEQYARFEKWYKSSTEEQLIKMTDHASGVVRAYAFWGLVKKESSFLREIRNAHMDDDEIIDTTNGCVMEKVTVAQFMDRMLKGTILGGGR